MAIARINATKMAPGLEVPMITLHQQVRVRIMGEHVPFGLHRATPGLVVRESYLPLQSVTSQALCSVGNAVP